MADQPATAQAIDPPPPQGARAVYDGGRVVPLEVVYVGVRDGLHMWEAVLRVPRPRELLIDILPGRSAVTVRMVDDDIDDEEARRVRPAGG